MITEEQYKILDVLYFVEPLEKIIEETGLAKSIVINELKDLIALKFVQVMVFDEKAQDYLPTYFVGGDEMAAFSYLASRKGLLAHTGFGKE